MAAPPSDSDVNFARRLDPAGWAAHAAAHSAAKTAMPAGVNRILAAYGSDRRVSLDWTTFRHIAEFLDKGTAGPERLEVACADFGFTRGELAAFRAAGVSSQEVAIGIVQRAGPPAPGPE